MFLFLRHRLFPFLFTKTLCVCTGLGPFSEKLRKAALLVITVAFQKSIRTACLAPRGEFSVRVTAYLAVAVTLYFSPKPVAHQIQALVVSCDGSF